MVSGAKFSISGMTGLRWLVHERRGSAAATLASSAQEAGAAAQPPALERRRRMPAWPSWGTTKSKDGGVAGSDIPGSEPCSSVGPCSSSNVGPSTPTSSGSLPLAASSRSCSTPNSCCSASDAAQTLLGAHTAADAAAAAAAAAAAPPCPPGDLTIDAELQAQLEETIWGRGGIAALFEAGELLGKGGEGEVRRVELCGNSYAVKRHELKLAGLREVRAAAAFQGTPWVMCPAMHMFGRSSHGADVFSIMPLAVGDLSDLLEGAEAAACARRAAAAAELGGGEPQPQEQPQGRQPAPAAGARAALKRGLHKFLPSCLKCPKVNDGAAPLAARAHGPTLPVSVATALAAEAVLAVGVIHGAGKVHHDVKPDNFLMGKDGHAAVADLGLMSDAHTATASGGTPGYAAPEVLLETSPWWEQAGSALRACLSGALKLEVDKRPQDIWSLGVTLLHVFLPLEEATAAKAKFERTGRWQLPAWVPEQLRDLLLRGMLRRNPKKRLTIEGVKAHPWFAGVDWAAVEARRGLPPVADAAALIVAARALRAAEPAAAAAAGN